MSSDIAIKVENLSKAYRIGISRSKNDTMADSMLRWIKTPMQNFKKLQSLSNISKANANEEDVFWALDDVSFELKQGEVLGIIGKNGAGKSTLLKVLSRIVQPTFGRVEMYGRVASLLEVGTGFNPDLTGKENVFLNGTILGLSKKEIEERYDSIIEFSGIEKFIETLTKAGIVYEDFPGKPNTINIRPDGIKQIFFTDPDGYWIEVNNDNK